MADPGLQIKGGGGGNGHPDPQGAGLKKEFLPPFGPHFGLKKAGAPPPPRGLSPGSATVITQCRRTKPKLSHTPCVYTGVGGQFMYDKGTSIHGHKLPVSRSVSAEKKGQKLIQQNRKLIQSLVKTDKLY